MKGFDLERALAGEPVRLRNGDKAFVKFKVDNPEYTYEVLSGFSIDEDNMCSLISWNEYGYYTTTANPLDIVEMWNDNIVKVDLPRPLKTAERNQRVYFITAKGISSLVYQNTANNALMLEDARFFATREDAQAWEDLAKHVRDM
ncbi:pyruvate kinase [Bisgaard Taxon 45]